MSFTDGPMSEAARVLVRARMLLSAEHQSSGACDWEGEAGRFSSAARSLAGECLYRVLGCSFGTWERKRGRTHAEIDEAIQKAIALAEREESL